MNYGIWVPLTEEQAALKGDDITYGSLCSARGSPITVRSPNPYAIRENSMENEGDVPLYRLRCLRGLYKTGMVKLPRAAQEPKYKWTVESYKKQGVSDYPGRRQLPCLLKRSKTYQSIQNKPLQRYYTQISFDTGSSFGRENSQIKPFDTSKKSSAFLTEAERPVLGPARTTFGRLLLRRPTPVETFPLTEDDSMFQTFTKSVELKPRNFKTTTEQDIFYNKNYPLLLDAHPEEEKSSVPRKRVPTPEVPLAPDVKRATQLLGRIDNLESAVDMMERETDDIEFRTVLRDEVFYPTMWTWNIGRKSHSYPPPPRQVTPGPSTNSSRSSSTSPSTPPLSLSPTKLI